LRRGAKPSSTGILMVGRASTMACMTLAFKALMTGTKAASSSPSTASMMGTQVANTVAFNWLSKGSSGANCVKLRVLRAGGRLV